MSKLTVEQKIALLSIAGFGMYSLKGTYLRLRIKRNARKGENFLRFGTVNGWVKCSAPNALAPSAYVLHNWDADVIESLSEENMQWILDNG